MKLVLLGAGRIGQVHAANVQRHPVATLHVVVDADEAAARALSERHGARWSTDAVAAVRDPDIDGVLVCTPTDTHVAMLELCAEQRRPAFCEKPIDLDAQRAAACLEKLRAAGVPLLLGFNRRFDPHFRALKSSLDEGALGRLEVLKITSRDPAPPPPAYVKVSGGLFRDMMIHDLDMARFLLGEDPVEIYATGSCLVDPDIGCAGDVDTAMAVLRTGSGVLCHIDNSRRAAYGYDQRIEAFGEHGMLQAENPPPTTLRRATVEGVCTDKPPYFFLERYEAAYRAELDHFVDVVSGSAAPLVDGADGLAALRLADAAARSLAEGRPVRLHEDRSPAG